MSKKTIFNIHNLVEIEINHKIENKMFARSLNYLKKDFNVFIRKNKLKTKIKIKVFYGEFEYSKNSILISNYFKYVPEKSFFRKRGNSKYLIEIKDKNFREIKIYANNYPFEKLVWVMVFVSLIKNGYLLSHSAAIDYKDKGILIPATGGTGKTATILLLLKNDKDVKFVSDDWIIISKNRDIFSIPKPLNLYDYHFKLIDQKIKKNEIKNLSNLPKFLLIKSFQILSLVFSKYDLGYYPEFDFPQNVRTIDSIFPNRQKRTKTKLSHIFYFYKSFESKNVKLSTSKFSTLFSNMVHREIKNSIFPDIDILLYCFNLNFGNLISEFILKNFGKVEKNLIFIDSNKYLTELEKNAKLILERIKRKKLNPEGE